MFQIRQNLYSQIGKARQKIVDLFADHCEHGQQTKTLNKPGQAACGQFIGPNAQDLIQRGLHGVAAAITVLSQAGVPSHRTTLEGLVDYLADHIKSDSAPSLHSTPCPLCGVIEDRCGVDANKTIKAGELLYALSHVPSAVPQSDMLRKALITNLQNGIIDGKGWSYFLDRTDGKPELLPTAYAMLGLSYAGEDISAPAKFVLNTLQSIAAPSPTAPEFNADVTVRVACLYVLCFQKSPLSDDTEKTLRSVFDGLWSTLEPLLSEDIEQNVEYWYDDDTTFYVRVPWQLYLLALAARLRFQRFGSVTAQTRLESILGQIIGSGFRYPHSGSMVSSRTNAIAYVILGHLQNELRPRRGFTPIYLLDLTRRAINSPWVRWPLGLVAVAFIVRAVWAWCGTGEMKDMAPDLLVTLLLALLSSATKRQ